MVTKFCNGCKKDIPLTDEYFASRTDRRVKYHQSLCRVCQKNYRREHYINNKQKYIDKAKIYNQNIINWVLEIKQNSSCTKCGEDRHWVLDFHHLDPNEKDIDVSSLVKTANKQRILDEINKCVVLCSNCHRDLHYQQKTMQV